MIYLHDLYGKLWKCLPVGGHANKKKEQEKAIRQKIRQQNVPPAFFKYNYIEPIITENKLNVYFKAIERSEVTDRMNNEYGSKKRKVICLNLNFLLTFLVSKV